MNLLLPRIGLIAVGIACCVSALAEEPRFPNVRDGKVFVRLSPEAFAELKNRPIYNEATVNDLILGTTVQGRCLTTGQAELQTNEKDHGLLLVVQGKCVTTSVGQNGPATIHSTTTTAFTATAPILYDEEHGFRAGEVTVAAKTDVNTHGIEAMQRGLIGRIVENVAERRVAEAKPMAAEIARQKAIARIQATVSEQLAAKLKEVNRSLSRLHDMVAVINPELTRDGCFRAYKGQLVLYFQADEIDHTALFRELPELTSTGELWVHQSVVDKDLQAQLSALTTVRDTAGVVVDSARKLLDPQSTGAVKAEVAVVKTAKAEPWLKEHGDWFVVRVPATLLKEDKAEESQPKPAAVRVLTPQR